jgi:hypothetical protein
MRAVEGKAARARARCGRGANWSQDARAGLRSAAATAASAATDTAAPTSAREAAASFMNGRPPKVARGTESALREEKARMMAVHAACFPIKDNNEPKRCTCHNTNKGNSKGDHSL